ncbi:MAG: SusC/RagA family TonB-linked outer membrane protein [Bacteroidetes bacterium]|nr:SusC/RagA family TonB-linked outer membrane protein [Bacteroidota bacterium]
MKLNLTQLLTSFMMLCFVFSFAQEKTVSGKVTDQNGAPLPGVSVLVVGTTTGTQSDFDGLYSISVAQGGTLRFSFIGQKTKDVVVGSSSTIDVQLVEDAQALEEVIVTGFGNVSKTSFAGSAKVVSGENISNKSFTNVSQALAGEAAGVAVFNTSGQPGSSSTIRIRGFGSVNGSEAPLYIVDDAGFGGSLNDINPNDIKSVTVLKDASATSLYGARGANGVIVITTKRGKDAGNAINVSVKTGTNYQGIGRYETIKSPEEYIGINWQATRQRGLLENNGDNAAAVAFANANLFENDDNTFSGSDISSIYNMWNVSDSGAQGVSELIDPTTGMVRSGVSRRYNPERWEDFAFQNSNRTEANLTISNFSDNSSLYTSVGFIDDIGYASNTDYKRLNARVAATNSFGDFIDMNTSLNYTQSETNNNGTGSSSSSQFWWIDNLPTIYPLYRRTAAGQKIEDPIYGGFLFDYGLEDGRGFGFATNGVADSQINISNSKANSVNFNNDTKITLADGLTFENNFAYQYFMSDNTSLNEPFYSPAKGDGGRINRSRGETKNYTIRTGLRYNKSFEDINLSAFVSHVATAYQFNYLEAERSKLVTPFGPDIANGVINNPSDGYTDNERTESYIANVTTDFKNKYFLNATFNRDASSRFINNKWGNFYSVGAAWVLTQEDFMSGVDFVDFLKVKASYGVLGQSAGVGFYPGYNIYSVNNLNDNISLAFTTKGNKDLSWESSNQFNTGFEFEMFGFVEGSIEYYTKETSDMFFARNVGPSVGYSSIQVNDGGLITRGLEFDFDFSLVKSSKFSLNLGINGESLKNEFLTLPIDPATGEQQKFINGSFAYEVGRSKYDWYMPVYSGVNAETGAAQWERNFDDKNSNGTFDEGDTQITSLTQYLNDNPSANVAQELTEVYAEATDKFINKTAIPDLRGAFRLNAQFGDFSLSTLFNYQVGGWAYDSAYASLMDNDLNGTNNFHVDIRDRWQAPGDVTNIPRQDVRKQIQQNSLSTRFLTKSDYIALNNIRIGYSVPKSITSKIGLKKADVFVTGDNLWFMSERQGFNPSTAITGGTSIYRYNPLSTIVLGVNLNL